MSTIGKNRAKFGYLSYESMLSKIASKQLDAFDINFAPDTKECYIITPDLTPMAVKSKVYTFADRVSAVRALNENTDTYEGQIVSVLDGDVYKAYIVNKDYTGFYLSDLSKFSGDIDYNELGNRPITNLTGTLDNPVIIEDLENGIYAITGQYQISSLLETVFLSAAKNIFIVDKSEEENIYIKKITSNSIVDYIVTADEVKTSEVLTVEYLNNCGFATTTYVDEKLAVLNFITKEEVDEYVKELVVASIDDVIDQRIDERIDVKLDERLQETEDDSILDLFS